MSTARVHDAFGTFFEVLRKLEAEPAAGAATATPAGTPMPSPTDDLAVHLMSKLPPDGSPRPLVDLLGGSGLGFTELTHALEALRRRDLAVVHGAPGHEWVELTSAGRRVAELISAGPRVAVGA